MSPKVAMEPNAPAMGLPAALASQVELIRGQLEGGRPSDSATLLRYVDAGLLNICEIAEVGFELLNRVLALRTACERLAQTIDPASRADDPEIDDALARALCELTALEEALALAVPSATTRAMGRGW